MSTDASESALPHRSTPWQTESFGGVRPRTREWLCDDQAYFNDQAGLFAVMDGCGNRFRGLHVVEACRQALVHEEEVAHFDRAFSVNGSLIGSMHTAMNEAVGRVNDLYPDLRIGVSVMVALLRRVGGYLVCSHVGNARVYRLRRGRLQRMTEDHTLQGHPDILTRALTNEVGNVQATHCCWEMQAGDRVLPVSYTHLTLPTIYSV